MYYLLCIGLIAILYSFVIIAILNQIYYKQRLLAIHDINVKIILHKIIDRILFISGIFGIIVYFFINNIIGHGMLYGGIINILILLILRRKNVYFVMYFLYHIVFTTIPAIIDGVFYK